MTFSRRCAIALAVALSSQAGDQIPRVAMVCAICTDAVLDQVSRGAIREFEKAGYVRGKNVEFILRGRPAIHTSSEVPSDAELAALYADVVALRPKLIMPLDVYTSAAANKVHEIPIVLGLSNVDAVRLDLVHAMSRPGTNITGFTRSPENLDVKRLEFLHAIAPRAKRIGILTQEGLPGLEAQRTEVRAAGAGMGLEMIDFTAAKSKSVGGDTEALFQRMSQAKVDAFILLDGNDWSKQLVELAARHRLPTVYPYTGPIKGGLAGYREVGAKTERVVAYAVEIMKGKPPGDLPVQRGGQFVLVLNTKTARALGIEFPSALKLAATNIVED